MREGTSGLLFSKKKNGVEIGVVDYGVEMFGGGDYERFYVLDKENAKKLKAYLGVRHKGSFEDMLKEEYGENFEFMQFEGDCEKLGIKYILNSWF